MNSMNYIGRIVSNFREFYNEINAATLTGAIDVVVVEQADGTFTCSPFHVRFGKLGVLRSREKVVDIEINGETQDIHMKLGDSGEAFFVEEVLSSDSEHIPEHLATSPIPISEFEKLYAPEDKPRRKSIDLGYNNDDVSPVLENQVNDYSKRRYTDSHNQDYSLKKREFVTRQLGLGNIELGEHSNEDLSLSRADSISVNKQSDEDCNPDSELSETIFKMDSLEAEQTPKETPVVEDLPKLENVNVVIPKVEEPEKSESDPKSGGNKKRRRKKSMIKKKNSQRKSSTVTEPKDLDVPEEVDSSKMCESITDKDSLGSSQSEHELISGSDSTMNSRVVGRDPDFLFFSDTELTANSERNTRPNTPVQSDTEFEVSQRKESEQPSGQSWAWGQLPNAPESMTVSMHEDVAAGAAEAKQAERNSMLSSMFSFMKQNKRMRHSGSPEGMYLADLSSGTLDPEVAALYFPNTRQQRHTSDPDNDNESGNGPSLPQSPSSVEGAKSIDSDYEDHKNDRYLQDISLSLCGWSDHPNEDTFIRHVVSFTDLCNNPSILESPDLVVRVKDKYYSWRAATPIIISMLVYQRQLPQSTIEQLLSMHMPSSLTIKDKSQKEESRAYSWWHWRRKGDRTSVSTDIPPPSSETVVEIIKPEEQQQQQQRITPVEDVSVKDELSTKTVETTTYSDAVTAENTSFIPDMLESQELDDSDASKKDMPSEMTQSMYGEKFRKTLRLSSDQIKKLNLNEGMNEVEFSVTTAYQGTTRCKCHIYRWRYDDKIVISDIDGTITKSDVLGHILPIVGKDWAQSGVAQLFTKIMNNGYKLLYLSARAIGQARVTREYLRSIKQGNLSLPDGPLLLNPTSLISAFHREVIEKKPEQFKISCLSDIQALFPPESNPFYAGYGNRINDVWAYRAVGIPIVRIFTINHKGELKHELTQTFQSSYSNMTSFVDQMFPPLLEAANDYSQFVYWREPIATIDEESALPKLAAK